MLARGVPPAFDWKDAKRGVWTYQLFLTATFLEAYLGTPLGIGETARGIAVRAPKTAGETLARS